MGRFETERLATVDNLTALTDLSGASIAVGVVIASNGGRSMNSKYLLSSRLLSLYLLIGMAFGSLSAAAAERTALDNDVHAAMALLLETSPAAKILAPSAKGALIFPTIVKAGFIVGIQYGNGALVRAVPIRL